MSEKKGDSSRLFSSPPSFRLESFETFENLLFTVTPVKAGVQNSLK